MLHDLVRRADVVIEASRPARSPSSAWTDPTSSAAAVPGSGSPSRATGGQAKRPTAWRSATTPRPRVASWSGTVPTPLFCADAVADPVTGLTAADACLSALRSGGRWFLDVSMAAVSAALPGPTLPAPPGLTVAAPHARPVRQAPELGADTAPVLIDEFDIDG